MGIPYFYWLILTALPVGSQPEPKDTPLRTRGASAHQAPQSIPEGPLRLLPAQAALAAPRAVKAREPPAVPPRPEQKVPPPAGQALPAVGR